MKANKIKFITLFLITIATVFGIGYLYVHTSYAESDDDETDSENIFGVINTSSSSSLPQATAPTVATTELSATVTQTTTTTIKHDTDKDGIYDDVDSHPTISEFFIVKDANLNGVDDRYEK